MLRAVPAPRKLWARMLKLESQLLWQAEFGVQGAGKLLHRNIPDTKQQQLHDHHESDMRPSICWSEPMSDSEQTHPSSEPAPCTAPAWEGLCAP